MKLEYSWSDYVCESAESQEEKTLERVLKLRQRRVRALGLLTVAGILLILGIAAKDKDTTNCDTKTKYVGRYAVCVDSKKTTIHLIPQRSEDKPHMIPGAVHVLLSETQEFYYTPDGEFIKNFTLNLTTGEKTLYERERK